MIEISHNINMPNMTDRTLSRTAGSAQRAGDWQTAAAAFTELLRRKPKNAKAWICLGSATAKLGFTEDAIEQVKRGLKLQPSVSTYRSLLADLLFLVGRCEESLAQAQKAIAIDNQNITAHELIAKNLERLARTDEALDYLQNIQETSQYTGKSTPPSLLNQIAHLLIIKKEYQQAQNLFKQIISRYPDRNDILRNAYQGLGQSLDRLQSYPEAYHAFTKCAEITQKSIEAKPFNIKRALVRIKQNQSIFTKEILHNKTQYINKQNNDTNNQSTPVFLVGFPRSGTTLAEQIFAAHPAVITTGERPILETMGRQWSKHAGRNKSLQQLINELNPTTINHLQSWYRQAASQLLGNNYQEENHTITLIDKQPMNITELALIQLIFPDVKIIVLIRDPRDVCLSCFFQDFKLNESTACFLNLENTATYYAAVMNWFIQLRDIITLPIMEIRYEELVSQFEQTTRRMTDFAGLPWDESILRFQEKTKSRAVTTPSAAAVREPVSKKSIARWRNYEEYFTKNKNITDALQPFITRWQYP